MCILGLHSVAYHIGVSVTLTSDLVLRIFVSGAYLVLFKVGIPKLVCEHASWDDEVTHTILGSLTLTSDLVYKIGIESGAYLPYSLRYDMQI